MLRSCRFRRVCLRIRSLDAPSALEGPDDEGSYDLSIFALGSANESVRGIILTVVVVVRTHLEDKTLHEELDGYAAYEETVKYRLIPGIW